LHDDTPLSRWQQWLVVALDHAVRVHAHGMLAKGNPTQPSMNDDGRPTLKIGQQLFAAADRPIEFNKGTGRA
jgi:hypothetical protein